MVAIARGQAPDRICTRSGLYAFLLRLIAGHRRMCEAATPFCGHRESNGLSEPRRCCSLLAI